MNTWQSKGLENKTTSQQDFKFEKSDFNSDHMCKGITLTEGIAKLLKMFGLNYHCVLVFETFFRKLIRNKFHCQIEFC